MIRLVSESIEEIFDREETEIHLPELTMSIPAIQKVLEKNGYDVIITKQDEGEKGI
jgi:hypothetical protein